MSKYTRQEIVKKANELSHMIAGTEEVNFFKQAEAQINQNEKVQQIINRIKLLQKESVNLQHYQKEEAFRQNEESIDQLMAELDEIPVVREFKQSQNEVNDLLQLITNTISNKVTHTIIESTGGDLVSGQTGAAVQATSERMKNMKDNPCQ